MLANIKVPMTCTANLLPMIAHNYLVSGEIMTSHQVIDLVILSNRPERMSLYGILNDDKYLFSER